MPKIRQKEHLKIDGEYRKKSGILTRSLKNAITKNINSKSFFKENNLHNSRQIEYNAIPFNDNNTPLFIEKLVNPVIPIEDELKSRSSILHTPNEFDTTFKIQKLTKSRFYDKNLETQFLNESIDFHPYDDATIESKLDLTGNKEKININLEFDDPCRLSLNKTNNNSVTLNSQTFIADNCPVVYYNFEDKKWDYLGKPMQEYFQSEENLKKIPLAFNSISPEFEKTKIENQTLGIPINTFGFPFDSRYRAMNRHLLKMKSYISKPFVVEKIKIKFIGTNLAEVEDNLNHSILNSLNFFVLNQRKNLNENSFTNLNLESGTYKKAVASNVNSGFNIVESNVDYKINEMPFFHNKVNINSSNESNDIYLGSKSTITYEESQASQRELVGYLSLVNFSSGSNNTDNIDYEGIKNNADYFYEELTSPPAGYTAKCIFNKKTLTLSGKVRTPVYYNTLESITAENIYPYSKFTSRTGTEYSTERSIKSDFKKGINIETTQDDNDKIISLGTNIFKENPYILNPTDDIIFGFSFNPSMKFFNNSSYSNDIFMLFENVKITLIGSYYANNESKKSDDTNFNLSNSKKVNFYESKNTTDRVGFNNIYLNKGAYYDSTVTEILSAGSFGQNKVVYEDFYSSAGNDNINPKRLFFASDSGTFTSYNIVEKSNEVITLEDSNNLETVNVILEELFSNVYFNKKNCRSARLTEDKKYVFDISDNSLVGYDIKLGISSVKTDASIYNDQGVNYIGIAGTSDAKIEIEPRAISSSENLTLFFVNINASNQIDFHLEASSIIIIKDSMPRNKSVYRYRSFGQPFDKLYEYRFLPYNDIDDNNKAFYTIYKRFKNLFLEEIEMPTLSFNVDQYSRISVPSPFSDDFIDLAT